MKASDVAIGSICGGGRYDNLTGIFGLPGISGVGISFGADRIYDVLTQLDAYPQNMTQNIQLMFVNFGQKEAQYALNLLSKVRASGINAEIYPDAAKMKKQMAYANNKSIPFVAMIGETEMDAISVISGKKTSIVSFFPEYLKDKSALPFSDISTSLEFS